MDLGINRNAPYFGNYWMPLCAAPVEKHKILSVKMVKRQNLISAFQCRLYGVYYFRLPAKNHGSTQKIG